MKSVRTMRISSRGRYALAAVISMARQFNSGEYITVISISENLGISKIYLEQVFALLKKADIVSATKGAQGGYQLTRPPEQITVLDILQAVELSLFEMTQDTVPEKAPDIEAALRSGTTSTANAAHALNRPVLAAPGPVTSPMSAGCHQLIRDQRAVLASQWGDVVDLLGAIGDGDGDVDRAIPPAAPTDALTHGQRLVLDALPLRTGLALDAVVRESGLSASAALACLGVLTAAGLAEQRGDTWRAVRV